MRTTFCEPGTFLPGRFIPLDGDRRMVMRWEDDAREVRATALTRDDDWRWTTSGERMPHETWPPLLAEQQGLYWGSDMDGVPMAVPVRAFIHMED